VVIFWPRKPFQVPLDENGMPMLWRNESKENKDVACVWWDEPVKTEQTAEAKASPMASFSNAMRPLKEEGSEGRRSVA
jgi:hypothetical protein